MKKFILTSILILSTLAGCMHPYKNHSMSSFADLKYDFPVNYATVGEVTMAYVDQGKGDQTIILVHGLGSYLPAWKKNIPELSKKYRVIAVDLPGYGKTSKGVYPIDLEYFADHIIGLMNKLNIKSAIWGGHSMGGQTAIVAALKYSDRIDKLMLFSPAGFERFSEGEKRWFREVMTVPLVKLTSVKQIDINLKSNFYNMPEDARFMITDRIALRDAAGFDAYCYAVVKSVEGMVDQPVIDVLAQVTQPTLIVFGENDQLIPNPYLHGGFTAEIANVGHQKIKNSKLVMIPECGHFVQFEKSEEVNQAIMEFLK